MILGLLFCDLPRVHQLLHNRVIGRHLEKLVADAGIDTRVANVENRKARFTLFVDNGGTGYRCPGSLVFLRKNRAQVLNGGSERAAQSLSRDSTISGEGGQASNDGIARDVTRMVSAHSIGHGKDGHARHKTVFVGATMVADIGRGSPTESQTAKVTIRRQRDPSAVFTDGGHCAMPFCRVPISLRALRYATANTLTAKSIPVVFTSPAPGSITAPSNESVHFLSVYFGFP